jgi:hypothetical protein
MSLSLPLPLAAVGGAGSNTEWILGSEGLSLGWAFLIFLVLMAANVLAYWRWAPGLPHWKRHTLIGLRCASTLILLVLLIKPVLNLTVNEPVRQSLLVLLDGSQSFATEDRRDRPDDLKRAAIVSGLLDPANGLAQEADKGASANLVNISRWELFKKLTANERLDFWPRIYREMDLSVYHFGHDAASLGSLQGTGGGSLSTADAVEFFKQVKPDKPSTAIGDSMRQVLQEGRGQPAGGLLLITDGQNNAGSSPLDAAQMAKEQNIPLYIYGMGVTSPPDLILLEVKAQKLAFAKEKVEVRIKVRSQGIKDQTIPATLKVDGVEANRQNLEIHGDEEQEVVFQYVPQDPGEVKLDVDLPVFPEESVKDNNSGTAKLRITDKKFHVLLIEQEPRWDFRYLLAYLQRDRRLQVRCVMINGEPNLDKIPDSPFLPALPDDRETFFNSEVLILGDVDPKDLGEERMQIIKEWVEAGGGIIFLTGLDFNPSSYAGTPLEALLPIVPDTLTPKDYTAQRSPTPFKLQLTTLGETSPYLQMSADPEENKRIWEKFPGVRWTAPVARLKPGAEVLLVDPRAEKMGRYGLLPVFAMQSYGAGTCVYLGTNETYRWRSGEGEKYYSILWGQIMQSLALQLLEGGSARTQLKTDRPQYSVGDKVTVSGKAYTEGFHPLLEPSLPGTLTVTSTDASGKITEEKQPLNLSAVPDIKGFSGEFTAKVPGEYSFSTARDPETVLRFDVLESRVEKLQTSLNERMLRAMAETSGGRFFREEDLNQFPDLLKEKRTTVASFKKQELYYSNWWLVALLTFVFLEWLLRRISQLK